VGPTASPATTHADSALGSPALASTSRVVNSFPLVNGTFTLSLIAADGTEGTITGTYTGQAVAAIPGTTTAALDMLVSSTTGPIGTVTGLAASGSGAFLGGGDFSLTLTVSTSTIKQDIKATLRGTSTLSCSSASRPLVTQHGTGSTSKFIAVTIDMQHEVGNAGCIQ